MGEGRVEETGEDVFARSGDCNHVDVQLLVEPLEFLHLVGKGETD